LPPGSWSSSTPSRRLTSSRACGSFSACGCCRVSWLADMRKRTFYRPRSLKRALSPTRFDQIALRSQDRD
jgi:hypothetical protein